jgi:glycosyltransferase involved in cell wall biosynthesis
LDNWRGHIVGHGRRGPYYGAHIMTVLVDQHHVAGDVRATWQVPRFDTVLWEGRKHAWCVVIPVINEGKRIINLLQKMAGLRTAQLADIIIVDGGSTDGSLDPSTLSDLGVSGLLVKTGAGKLSAQLRCAYAFVLDHGYQGIVTIDGNDKDDPEGIPRLINALQDGYDFVQASRFIAGGLAENTPRLRSVAIRLIHAPSLSLASGFRWTDTTQGFRAYSRRMLLDPRLSPFRDVFSSYELLAYLSCRAPRLGYRCVEVPSIRRYPKNEVPTKISSFKGNLSVLAILLNACLGRYDAN